MSHKVGRSLRYSLLLSVPVWCASLVAASAACVTDATTHNVTCDGTITNSASPTGQGYPLTIYDQAAQFQPTGGSNSYTPTTYSQTPAPAIVTINQGATFTVNITNSTTRSATTTDGGVITANYSNSESPAVNNVIINNAGTFTINNAQYASRVSALVADSQVNSFTLNNAATGTINISQTTAALSGAAFNKALLTNLASGTPATVAAQYAGSTLAITSGMYSDDNTNTFVVNNAGTLTSTGHFATNYYGRADTTITNTGTIQNTDWKATDTIADGHWAIAAYAGTEYNGAANTNPDASIVIPNSDGSVSIDDTSALTITNKKGGTIKGDILALDITPLVYAAAVGNSTNPFPNPTQTTLLQLPVGSGSAGPRDSNIVNQGNIQGNLYLGSGAHKIQNASGAVWQGSVYVDQRPFQASFKEPTPGTVAGTYVSSGGNGGNGNISTGSPLTGKDANGNPCPAAGQNTTNPGCATTTNKIATVVGAQTLALSNKGTLTGDIRIFDQATSKNQIALYGNGFSGNIVAVTGTGNNTLSLSNVSNLQSVQNFRTIDLNRSNVTVANGVSLVSGATIKTTVYGTGGTRAAPSTKLGTINGTLSLAGPTTLVANFKNTYVRNGDVYQVASTVNGAGAANITVKQRQSALVQSRADTSDGRLLLVTNVRDPRNFAGVSQPTGATLNGLVTYDGTNPQVRALGAAVEALPTQAAVRAAGDQLAPNTNGADVQVPINATMLFHQQIDSRLDNYIFAQILSSGRSADLGPGRPAPVYGVLPADGGWIEGIGGGIHQSTVNNVGGYNAELEGVIGGLDRLITPNIRVGGAFGFINGQVNGNQVGGRRETIQTFQGLGYAEFSGTNYYLRGSAGYGGVNIQSSRQIAFAGFSDTAFGSHSGNVFTARGEGGAPFEYRNSLLIPYAAFTYSRLEQNAYTEASANGAGLSYQYARNNSERSEVGGKVIVPLAGLPAFSYLFPASSTVALEARAAYVHEFGNVAQTVSASFTGGGGVFVAAGPVPNRDMVDYGVGLRMGSGPVQIDISYNGLARSTYLQQVGLLRVRYLF